jgi:hypothetical protein
LHCSRQGGTESTLRVKTDVAGVKVLLDDQEAGETPVTITPVAPGRHRVTLLKAGYQDHAEDVEVQPGATARLFVVMKRIEISLPSFPVRYRALHQHRYGACIGHLTLTADAADYRSDDGTDVFHLPMSDVRSVARSAGPMVLGGLVEMAAQSKHFSVPVIPVRIEVPGRGYGFWAMDSQGKTTDPHQLDEAAAQKTKELFEIVYRLWQDSRTAREKPAVK